MSNYQKYWDRYVTELFPRAEGRGDVHWPGDEWGREQRWQHLFRTLLEPADVTRWKLAVEIGQGSGKYTKPVLDAAPECTVAAFDVSGEFLRVCGERLAPEVEAGRLHLERLRCERADEMIEALERLGMAGRVDAFYSIDAMVHVDLQYMVTYLLTASVALRPGGHLVMTLADATSDRGFDFLLSRVARFYGRQGRPAGKFEWVSPDIARAVLQRLGFEVVRCESPPRGRGRDIHVIATLVRPEQGRQHSWALCDEPEDQRRPGRHLGHEAPVLEWDAVPGATAYVVELSMNKFGSLLDVPRRLTESLAFALPDALWQDVPEGRPLHWRVVALCPDRKRIARRGALVRVARGETAA